MGNNYSFVSIITSDDYLPGLLVLFSSLMKTKSRYPFLALLTPSISSDTISIINKHSIPYKILTDKISNPTDINKEHRWFSTYSKIHVFNQIQYSKIVYLDADMLILKNIDELFRYPHLSATNAGSMLPRKASWTYINSGLFVVEPSRSLFLDMMSKVGKIEKVKSGGTIERPKNGSDQDFINAYYPNWPKMKELHLDHKYNIFHYYIDEYNALFGYSLDPNSSKPISVIHFASYLKPWNISGEEMSRLENDPNKKLELEAIRLWIDNFNRADVVSN